MTYDIIDLSADEMDGMSFKQIELLRAAQKKKIELEHKLNADIEELKRQSCSRRVEFGTLIPQVTDELKQEYKYRVEVLREQLIFDLAHVEREEEDYEGSDIDAPYRVDYRLSYLERYIIVKDYYLTIADADERLNIYRFDTVAFDYLGSYYGTLFNYFASLAKDASRES